MIWRFFSSRFEEPKSKAAELSKKLYRWWMPFVIVLVIITTPLSLPGVATRAMIVAVLTAELLRLHGYFAWLNLWGARITEILISCMALGLVLFGIDERLVTLSLVVLIMCYFYVRRNYLGWRSNVLAGVGGGAGSA